MTEFRFELRTATRTHHDAVDALFGTFDLADLRDYTTFLRSQAAAFLPVERWLMASGGLDGWSPRGDALVADLSALDAPVPAGADLDWASDSATRWGAAYVLEGSRLGGRMLARSVPASFPRSFLSGGQNPNGWQSFITALNAAARQADASWRELAVESARSTFDLFAASARSAKVPNAD